MTADVASAPTMRPNHCWSLLQVSVMAVLLLNSNADGEEPDCETVLEVRRDTVYEGFAGDDLTLECPVKYCNNSPPNVLWLKFVKGYIPVNESDSHIKTEWNILNESEAVSLLIFKNIHKNDSGTYRCQSGSAVGHAINVSVRDSDPTNVTMTPDSQNPTPSNGPPGDPMLYVYSGAGIATFVIIVIVISVVSMQGCKRKVKTERQVDNTYMVVPMVEQPHARPQPSPRGSPAVTVPRRSVRKTPASQPVEQPSPRDSAQPEDRTRGSRAQQRNTAKEDEGSLVYAALNHQLPAGAAARPWRPVEESSEYAAIRVSGH